MIKLRIFLHGDETDETAMNLLPDYFENALNRLAKKTSVKLTELGLITPKSKQIIELNLMSNKQITEINKELRGKNTATDVISLRFTDSAHNDQITFLHEEIFGEIYISLEKCAEQADEIGQSFKQELAFLTLHGLLHIFDYDHQTPTEEETMMALAYEILGRK